MDILCEKRQDVKEHLNLEWNLCSAKKVSQKRRQLFFGAWARTETPILLLSEVFSKMDLCYCRNGQYGQQRDNEAKRKSENHSRITTCSAKVLSAHIAPKILPHLGTLLQVIKMENK